LTLDVVKQALDSTAKLSAFVMFILIGARVFGLTFYGLNGHIWIEELLLALPGGQSGFLFFVTIIVFILGCFLDFFEIAFIMVPLLAPAAEKLGIDLIWFGVILGINLQTSFLTPPFGFALFYLRSIAPAKEWHDAVSDRILPAVKTTEIYKGALPYIVIQFMMIMLVIFYPGLVTHYKDDGPKVDPNTIKIEVPSFGGGLDNPGGLGGGLQLPGLGGGLGGGDGGLPGLTLPPLGTPPADGGAAPAPSFGLPGQLNLNGEPPKIEAPEPPAAPAIDLSQPPVINN
jgi:hypothetical protein